MGAPYCPFTPHVKTELPLHVTVLGVHAQHAPDPLHVPPEHVVPGAVGVVPQALFVQVVTRHAEPVGGQSVAERHATHVPLEGSQMGVLPLHAAPCTGCPFPPQTSGLFPLHECAPGVQRLHCPDPSQRPAPPAQGVSFGSGEDPHVPPPHVAVAHSAAAGHWAAVVQATHAAVVGSQ